MARIVQKYGGSSVSDLTKLARVADRIAVSHRAGNEVVVVVSAMGNTTNELLALAREVSSRPDRRELDMLASVGERISMSLLAMALRERSIPARSLTGSQSGIITDEAHADARVVEVRPQRVLAHLERGEVVIVAGFQGVSRDREVTTLGRGGSDTTAVVLAAALEADWCEICSDVDGVWSADPRQVPAAEPIPSLSLDEALSLARGGAKVLFEDAVKYARDRGVQLRASSTFGPGSGTRITAEREVRSGAVAVTGDGSLLSLPQAPDLGARLRAAGGRVRRVADGRVYVDTRNAHGGLEGWSGAVPAAIVSAVGTGLGEDLDAVMRATSVLGSFLSGPSGAAGDVAWWEVAPDDIDDAVRALHAALIESRGDR